MAIDATTLVGGALGGAVVSSVVGPSIAQRHERRDLRAKVLRSLAEVERRRWAPGTAWGELRDAAVGLQADALVAGINRQLVDRYVELASVGHRTSQHSWDATPDPDFGGGI